MLKKALIIFLVFLLLPLLGSCGLDKRPQHNALDGPMKPLLGLLAIFAALVVALVLYLSPPHASRGQSLNPWNVPPQNSAAFHFPSVPAYPQAWPANSGPLSLEVLYHGTPILENAIDITDPNSGFVIGPGNAFGTGLYLADLPTAKGFAKGNGAILEMKLEVPSYQIADLNSVTTSADFTNWCFYQGNGNQGDNITNFALTVLKKRFIKVSGQKIFVALANQTSGNQRVVFEGLTILGVLDARGNPL